MKKYVQQVLSKNLLHYRQKRGLSQEQLAEMAGISQSFYAKIESGSRLMAIDVLYKLAQQLDVSVDTLLDINVNNAQIDNMVSLLSGRSESDVEAAERVLIVFLKELDKARLSNDEK